MEDPRFQANFFFFLDRIAMSPMLASLTLSLRYLLALCETGSYNVDLACLEFAMYAKLAWNLEKSIHPYFPRTVIKGVHCHTSPLFCLTGIITDSHLTF